MLRARRHAATLRQALPWLKFSSAAPRRARVMRSDELRDRRVSGAAMAQGGPMKQQGHKGVRDMQVLRTPRDKAL